MKYPFLTVVKKYNVDLKAQLIIKIRY